MHSGRRVASSVREQDAGHYKMPESFSAFCNIVSFTAAKTRRIFDVSVACVRLQLLAKKVAPWGSIDILWVEVEMRSIHLVKSPEQIFGGAIHIVASGIVRKVVSKW
jgi:hypothetical protein